MIGLKTPQLSALANEIILHVLQDLDVADIFSMRKVSILLFCGLAHL